MSPPISKIKKLPSKELREEYTNELVLLGLFYFAQKYGCRLGRMQTAKLLWKFKDLIQKQLKLQAYYTEAYKDKHGRFNKEFYNQIDNLKTADFVESFGAQPYETFKITQRGKRMFEKFDIEDKQSKYALRLIRENLGAIIRKHGKKSATLLEKEDHGDIKKIDTLPLQDEDIILCRNLKPNRIKYQFLFDNQTTLDWAIVISIGERKKTEKIIPEDLLPKMPKNQKEAYKILGL